MHHNDAGSQYTSIAFTERLVDAGVDPSVGSVGDAYDNALAETHDRAVQDRADPSAGPWRDVDHVEVETLQWVHWFNTERPHEYIDDLTPERPRSFTTICEPWQSLGDSANRVPGHAGRSHLVSMSTPFSEKNGA